MIRQSAPFRQRVSKPTRIPGPETIPAYWNPNRQSIRLAPEDFRKKLRAIDPELECTWNPIEERWLIFQRAPRMQHPLCSGWMLLFVVKNADGSYAPLDQRVFARLYAGSARAWGSAKEYFNRIEAEMQRDRESFERANRQDTIDQAMPYYDHSQIKNIGKGSKFSTYHA